MEAGLYYNPAQSLTGLDRTYGLSQYSWYVLLKAINNLVGSAIVNKYDI